MCRGGCVVSQGGQAGVLVGVRQGSWRLRCPPLCNVPENPAHRATPPRLSCSTCAVPHLYAPLLQKEDAKKALASVDSQFRTLYSDKYLPLKAEAGGLRAELAGLQKRVVAEELKVRWLMCMVCATSWRVALCGVYASGVDAG
jgi:hypothetical protein